MQLKQVLKDRLVVRPVRTPIKYGKIFLPESSVRNTSVAKVIKLGPEVKSPTLKVDAFVICDNLAGTIIDKEENLLLLRESDVIAVVESYQQGEVE